MSLGLRVCEWMHRTVALDQVWVAHLFLYLGRNRLSRLTFSSTCLPGWNASTKLLFCG